MKRQKYDEYLSNFPIKNRIDRIQYTIKIKQNINDLGSKHVFYLSVPQDLFLPIFFNCVSIGDYIQIYKTDYRCNGETNKLIYTGKSKK